MVGDSSDDGDDEETFENSATGAHAHFLSHNCDFLSHYYDFVCHNYDLQWGFSFNQGRVFFFTGGNGLP